MRNILSFKKRKIKSTMPIVFLVGAFFLSMFGAVVFFSENVQAAASSTIYFNPANKEVNSNDTFTLDAVVNPGSNPVIGMELHVAFDPTKVKVTGIQKNSFFGADVIGAEWDNTAGTAKIAAFSAFTAAPPTMTTTSTVATFTFQAIGSGSSLVSFSSDTMVLALGESINVLTGPGTPATVVVDGVVVRKYTLADFVILAGDWLQSKVSTADVNTDGIVNSRDLGMMMSGWDK